MRDDKPIPLLRAYPEMYCLFSAGIRIARNDRVLDSGKALRLICNVMGRLDHSLDNCADECLRKQIQSLVVSFLREEMHGTESSPLEKHCIFEELSELRSTLPKETSVRLAELAQMLFHFGENDRTETSIAGLIRSRSSQGRLAALAVVTAIGVHCPEYIRMMQAFGATGQLWDSLNDVHRDYTAGEIVIEPSFSLKVAYFSAFAKELMALFVEATYHPVLFMRVCIESVKTGCLLFGSRLSRMGKGADDYQ